MKKKYKTKELNPKQIDFGHKIGQTFIFSEEQLC